MQSYKLVCVHLFVCVFFACVCVLVCVCAFVHLCVFIGDNVRVCRYCGHNDGRFLCNDTLQTLHMRATALLIGCRSAGLKEDGQCDPSGHVLNYLMAGW